MKWFVTLIPVVPKTNPLIHELRKAQRHQTIWGAESGTPVYNGSGGHFGRSVEEREKPIEVRMVIKQQKYIFFAVSRCAEFDEVEMD